MKRAAGMPAFRPNWVHEYRFFFQNLTVRPLSAIAQALWHYLMMRANNAFWQFPLMLRTNEIAGAIGTSPASVKRARLELQEHRYICFFSHGSSAAEYYIFSNVEPQALFGLPEGDYEGARHLLEKAIAEAEERSAQAIDRHHPEYRAEVRQAIMDSLASAPGCETVAEFRQRMQREACEKAEAALRDADIIEMLPKKMQQKYRNNGKGS